jgi:mannosyltransferase PIG-V
VAFLALAAIFSIFGKAAAGIPARQWLCRVYSHGDAGHFLTIAKDGYYSANSQAENIRVAFFPGYPLLGRFLAHAFDPIRTSDGAYLAALATITSGAALVSSVFLWIVTFEGSHSSRIATWAVVAFLFGPYSVFLIASYSESLFVAFALAAWISAGRQRWVSASLFAAGASAIRVNGLFLAAALGALYIIWWSKQETKCRFPAKAIALAAVPTLPILGYFAWLHAESGQWSEWFRAQKEGWARTTVWPWDALANSVSRLWEFHAFDLLFQDAMELAFAAALVTCSVLLARRRRWPELVFVGLTTLSLLTSAYYLSVPRSLLTCFPIFVLLGEWLARQRSRLHLVSMILISTTVLVIDSGLLLTNRWAG